MNPIHAGFAASKGVAPRLGIYKRMVACGDGLVAAPTTNPPPQIATLRAVLIDELFRGALRMWLRATESAGVAKVLQGIDAFIAHGQLKPKAPSRAEERA